MIVPQVVLLEQDASAGAVATVVLRGSTEQLLDDLERALDDGVNTYKARMRMRRFQALLAYEGGRGSSCISLVQLQQALCDPQDAQAGQAAGIRLTECAGDA